MARKLYDEDFKSQLVKINIQGNHSYRSLTEEYGVTYPTIRTWAIRYNKSSSFNIDNNRTKEVYNSPLLEYCVTLKITESKFRLIPT